MTAGLCAGCILPCTCRLWWSGRWADTAGSSLHCCDCTDWCLGSQKHTRSEIKGGLTETRADVLRVNKAPRGNDNITSNPLNVFGRVISAEQTGCKKRRNNKRKVSCTFLHRLIVDFHVHHGRRAVAQDFPVAAVLLVADSDLVGSLIGPPQLVS